MKATIVALGVALLGHAGAASAQTVEYGPGKIAEVYERNAAEERIHELKIWNSGDPVFWAVTPLGDGHDAFGNSTTAQAWVDDGGTFWASVEADNNRLPYQDYGNGEASTTIAWAMHKAKDEPGEVTLQITGGKLDLIDYGGGTAPLEAVVIVQVDIRKAGETDSAHDELWASVSGRGGMLGAETFGYDSERFDMHDANYTESGSGKDIYEAELEIPAQTVRYGLEYFCDECDFEFWVELSVFANNPGGETKAYAYFRDPIHVDDAEPDLGGASLSWSGVTLRPPPQVAPEPGKAMATGAALAAIALNAQRSRGRAPRSSRTTPRATAPADRTRAT